jgi:quercetin dioxygenase-like cupin family protein
LATSQIKGLAFAGQPLRHLTILKVETLSPTIARPIPNPLHRRASMRQHFARSAVGLAFIAFVGAIVAQTPGLTRTIVTRADVSVPNREAVIARVELAPGGIAGWHTHPGDEISHVNEGEVTLMIAGQPPRKVAAGQGFVIPAGVVHNASNEGSSPARLVGVYVVEKGQPLASPASAPGQ